MSKYISLDKCLFIVIIILSIFMPLREFLSLYLGQFIKFIPDILVLLLLLYYVIKNKFRVKLNLIDILFLGFILIGLISTLYNHSSIIGFIAQARSISVMYALFFLLRKIPLNEKKYIMIFKIIFYTSIAFLIIAVGESITDKHLFFPLEWAQSIRFETNFARVYGILNNPNTFAIYLLLIMIMAWFLTEKGKMKVNWLYYYLCLTVIFLTSSRSTIILLIISIIFFVVWIFKHKKYFKLATLCFVLAASFSTIFLVNMGREVILIEFYNGEEIQYVPPTDSGGSNEDGEPSYPDDKPNDSQKPEDESGKNPDDKEEVGSQGGSIIDRFEEMLSGETFINSLADGRVHNILLGLDIFKDNALLGTGFGTFGSAGSRIAGSHIYEEYNIEDQFYADNEYIKVLVEVGIVGTIIYIGFILVLGIMCLNSNYKILLYVLILFTGLFYNIFELQVLMFLIYLFLVILEKFNSKSDLSKLNKLYKKSKEDYYKEVKSILHDGKKKMIVTANPETIMLFNKDSEMGKIYSDESIDIIPDGIGVVVAAKMLKYNISERITGVDLSEFLMEEGNKQKKSIYFFGSKQEVIDAMLKVCKQKYPNLKIVGASNGYVKDRDKVFQDIIKKEPDICLVALGIPDQEKLIYEHLNDCKKGIFVGVGGSLDVLSGTKKRAPKLFQKLNLEWLYRIISEPKRLGRFFKSNVRFISDVLNYEK